MTSFGRYVPILLGYILLSPLYAASPETLKDVCDRIEKERTSDRLQEAVNECRRIAKEDRRLFTDEENPLVQERFCHAHADVVQRLAAKIEDTESRRALDSEAFDCWEEYFEWLRSLSTDDYEKVVNSSDTQKGKKIFSAAAAIGISGLAADRADDACADYEHLDTGWLGSEALNWWLASLISPNQPSSINDTIFSKVAGNASTVSKHSADPKRREHWNKFVQTVRLLISSGRFKSRESQIEAIAKALALSKQKGPL